ncbi:MAG: hypothetical protein NTU91_09980 [Chloroflexi bacterium]|nr:hypothetical protein [Chloroflexota bacterium]
MAELKAAGFFFALSFTVTRSNVGTITDPAFVHSAVDAGCKLFFCMEYTPISAAGDVEPCPLAPYSDASLKKMPRKDALRSPFMESMRDNHDLFRETAGGCALWKNREQVEALLGGKLSAAV